MEPTAEEDRIAREVVDAAYTVHKTLGPGLLESVYEQCLACELELRGISVRRQVSLPIVYKTVRIDTAFRLDLVVGDLVVVEVKAIDKLAPVQEAQLLTYLKLSPFRLGFLINFNVALIKDGIRRIVRSV